MPDTNLPWDERLRRDPTAPDEVFARYAERLARIAEKHLSGRLAGRLDPEDITQSVFRTFFRRSEAGQFRIDSSAQLWSLLVRITVMKARANGRFHSAGKRNAAAEAGDDGAMIAAVPDAEPGPEEGAIFADQVAALLAGLPPSFARILELRMAGDSIQQIADATGLTKHSVDRDLKVLQKRLEKLVSSGGQS